MTRFVDGNQVALLEGGREYFPALLSAIDTAKREIFLEAYIFANDDIGRSIADALCNAARRGVRVQVQVDGFGGRAFVDTIRPALEAAGVQVLIYRREIRALSPRRHRLRRLHRKIVVVDDRVAFVGGINVIDDIDPGGPPHPRHDYAVRIEGPLLRDISTTVRRLWWLVSWANLRQRRAAPSPQVAGVRPIPGGVRAALLIRDNLRHRRDIEEAYLGAIAGARSDILIASAYFFPGRSFRQALIDAARRGVRVVLLLQGLSDHPLLAHASRALYPRLLDAGVRLYEYRHAYLHAKVAVVDTRWATVGSSNIDPFSLLLAREANVVIDDVGFAAQLRHSLLRAIDAGAVEMQFDTLRRRPLLQRMASWVAYKLVRMALGLAGFGGQH